MPTSEKLFALSGSSVLPFMAFGIIGWFKPALFFLLLGVITNYIIMFIAKSRHDQLLAWVNSIIIMVFAIVFFALYLQHLGLKDSNDHDISLELALTFSLGNWVGIGFDNISPSPPAMIWIAIEALLGYIHLALIIALSVVIFSSTPKDY